MFTIDADKTIHITRGDAGVIAVSANKTEFDPYVFRPGDVIRFKVFTAKHHDDVVVEKDIDVAEETTIVDIGLDPIDTRIGDIINKPADYWYEIELNPDTVPQTIIGYDNVGPKIFRLYPEGGDRK